MVHKLVPWGVAPLLMMVACSRSNAPDAGVHDEAKDAPLVDAASLPSATPAPVDAAPIERIVTCRSGDGAQKAELHFLGGDAAAPSSVHVILGRPTPLEQTMECSPQPGGSASCSSSRMPDTGYLADVSLARGHHRIDVQRNGVATTHLATIDCTE